MYIQVYMYTYFVTYIFDYIFSQNYYSEFMDKLYIIYFIKDLH